MGLLVHPQRNSRSHAHHFSLCIVLTAHILHRWVAPWDRARFLKLLLFAQLTPNLTLPEPALVKVRRMTCIPSFPPASAPAFVFLAPPRLCAAAAWACTRWLAPTTPHANSPERRHTILPLLLAS